MTERVEKGKFLGQLKSLFIYRYFHKLGLFESYADPNTKSTIDFWLGNCPRIVYFLDQPRTSSDLTDAAVRFHRGDVRKVTRDPYFKHLFYTGYLIFEHFDQEFINPQVVFFHDAIELRRKQQFNDGYSALDFHNDLITYGLDDGDGLRELVLIVDILTPTAKADDIARDDWIKVKIDNFRSIMDLKARDVSNRYREIFQKDLTIADKEVESLVARIKIIKLADLAANMRETVVDLQRGVDEKHARNGMKDLDWRIEEFRQRLMLIEKYFSGFPLLEQMSGDLRYMEKLIS